MDPTKVLDELESIGVFEVPTLPTRGFDSRLESNPSQEGRPSVSEGLVGDTQTVQFLTEALRHAEGLVRSLKLALNKVPETVEPKPAAETAQETVTVLSAATSEPPLQSSPAYEAALQKALEKIKGEAHLVPEALPVQRPGQMTSATNLGESEDIYVGSSISRVKPADPSEFISVGKG